MSLAFRLRFAPSAAVRRLSLAAHAVGVAGVLLSCAYLWRSGHPGLAWAMLAAGALLLRGSIRRGLRGFDRGELQVSPDGAACWQDAAGPGGGRFQPRRWHVIGPLVWLQGACEGRAVTLLSGRDGLSDPGWSRLMAWLRWLDRGGGP